METNPYQPPTTTSDNRSPTDVSFGQGLLYWLGGVALRIVVFVVFICLALALLALGIWFE